MKGELSICIPMYNCEKYICECLMSIYNQESREKIEIILIDDGSIDKSVEVAKRVIEKYNLNAYLYENEKNMGVAYTRNRAIEKASANYVMFLDSDDTIEENLMSKVSDIIKEKNFDMILWGFNQVDEELNLLKSETNLPEECTGSDICHKLSEYDFRIRIGSYIIKRDILIKNQIKVLGQYKYGEDQELNYKCLLNSSRVKVLEECFYNYRWNSQSAMNRTANFQRFDAYETRKNLVLYIEEFFADETVLINRFKEVLLPEAIITITRVLVYSGMNRKELKNYIKSRKYDVELDMAIKSRKLCRMLYLEMIMQKYMWGLYCSICQLKKKFS